MAFTSLRKVRLENGFGFSSAFLLPVSYLELLFRIHFLELERLRPLHSLRKLPLFFLSSFFSPFFSNFLSFFFAFDFCSNLLVTFVALLLRSIASHLLISYSIGCLEGTKLSKSNFWRHLKGKEHSNNPTNSSSLNLFSSDPSGKSVRQLLR